MGEEMGRNATDRSSPAPELANSVQAAPPAPEEILGRVRWPTEVDQDARIRIVFGAEIDPLLDAEHRWQLLADGQVLATAQGNDGIPLSTMGVEAGVYELTVRLTDGLDRSAEETIRIRIGPPA